MAASHQADRKDTAGRTLAQTFCSIFGLTLLAVGILGFIIGDSSFDTGDGVQGDELIIFEVNGWHNIVHIASGLLLLLAAPKAALAATMATLFGLVYLLVTILGFIDGEDVLGLIPVNDADNVLHLAITAAALFSGLTAGGLMAASRKDAGTHGGAR